MNMLQTTWLIPLVAGVIYVLLFLLERRFSLRRARHALWRRVGVNAIITSLALATAAISVRPAVEYLLWLSPAAEFGLLHLLDLPRALEFGGAFVLFDWSFYWWHRANHHIPLLSVILRGQPVFASILCSTLPRCSGTESNSGNPGESGK